MMALHETISDSDFLERLYRVLFGRGLDPAGRDHWTAELAQGRSRSDVAAALSKTLEAQDRALSFSSPDDLMAAIASAPAPEINQLDTAELVPVPPVAGALEASLLRDALMRDGRARKPQPLWVHGWKAFSQADEDGILAEIFRRCGISSGRFLEVGASDGTENITTHWLLSGFKGAWIEGDSRLAARATQKFRPFVDDGRLQVACDRIDRDNAASILTRLGATGEHALLSIDIDGNDYAVAEACLSVMVPQVVVLEYNPKFGPLVDWVMPYDPRHTWTQDDWYGASLAALTRLCRRHGLELVGCNILGSNAFFVRADLADAHFPTGRDPQDHWEPARYHMLPAFFTGHPIDRNPDRRFEPMG